MENRSETLNDSQTTEQWNKELVIKYLPLTMVLFMYLLVGVSGNSMVLFIYFKKFKTYSEGRFFIPVLAVVDMLGSVANCLFFIAITVLPVMYVNDLGCKIAWFIGTAVTANGMFILVLVAINRFLMICKPFNNWMSPKGKRISIFISVIFAVVISAPCFVFCGTVKVYHEDGITGYVCAMFTGGFPHTVSMAFSMALVAMVTIELAIMSALYFRICTVITQVNGDTLKTFTEIDGRKTVSGVQISVVESSSGKAENKSSESAEEKYSRSAKQLRRGLFTRSRKIPRSRITMINIAVTIAFAISFLPKVTLIILESVHTGFVATDPDKGVSFMFLNSAYILNNIVNPFIYGFMDKRFRFELKQIFCGRCSKPSQT